MDRYHIDVLGNARLTSVIIHYRHVVSVSAFEPKTDTPSVIDCHCPLSGAVALELVQADAFQGTQVLQAAGGAKRRK
jgi:hypothetical protein